MKDRLTTYFHQTVPFLPLVMGLLWLWGGISWTNQILAYGDSLEIIWAFEWLAGRLPGSENGGFISQAVFAPFGWSLTASANGPIMLYLMSRPLLFISNSAVVYHFWALLAFCCAYLGMWLILKRDVNVYWAAAGAFLFAFWVPFTVRVTHHLLIVWGAALLPWIWWGLQQSAHPQNERKRWLFAGTAALAWALAVSGSLYFLWIGGFVWLGWLMSHRGHWKAALTTMGIAAVGSLPAVWLFWQGLQTGGTPFYDLLHLSGWGISPDLMALPSRYHPLFGPLILDYYAGQPKETQSITLGLFSTILLLVALLRCWKNRAARPWIPLFLIGLILGLGPYLNWNGELVQVNALQPINQWIWEIGSIFKPDLFVGDFPPPALQTAVPMPGLLLNILVPFWEGARVSGRFAFVAGMAMMPLLILFLSGLKRPWLAILLFACVLVEQLPARFAPVAFRPPPHPIWEVVDESTPAGAIIVDVYAPFEEAMGLVVHPHTLWATTLHGRATAAPASSVFPPHTQFLQEWLLSNRQGFQSRDLRLILQQFGVTQVVLHVDSAVSEALRQTSDSAADFSLSSCVPATSDVQLWPYEICVLEVLPPNSNEAPAVKAALRDGWSGREPWGVWIESREATADVIALEKIDHRLLLELFPNCNDNQAQSVRIELNGVELTNHQWDNCDPVPLEVVVPADAIEVGWNQLNLTFGYAISPAELTEGANPDSRPLAAAVTTLSFEP